MARYLGIDYGDKRIGIAISDEEASFAFPKGIIANHSNPKEGFQESDAKYFSDEIKKIISLEPQEFAAVIVGLPQNFSSKDTEQTAKVRGFAENLKKELGVEVIFENEILTSRQIERTGASSNSMIDASSAALILQSFLDKRRNK